MTDNDMACMLRLMKGMMVEGIVGDRNRSIVRDSLDGVPLGEVARIHGLSRERCRQIIVAEFCAFTREYARMRAIALADEDIRAENEELRRRVYELERQNATFAGIKKRLPSYGGEEADRELLATPLDRCGFSTRTRNCLVYNRKLRTVGDLVRCTESQVSEIRNLGRKGVAEIKEFLGGKGLGFFDPQSLVDSSAGYGIDDEEADY